MATVEQTKNALAKTEANAPVTIESMIKKATAELGMALPQHMNAERMVRIALTAIRLNPDLAKCTPLSFMGALFTSAQLGLEPIAGRAFMIPFNNRRKVGNEWKTVKEVQFQIGYKGLIELFYRHESALSIDMQTVKERDEFAYEYGTNASIKHRPATKDRGNTIGFYAIGRLKGGASVFHFMSVEDAMDHAKQYSKTFDTKTGKFYDSSPWSTAFDSMAMKTCVIRVMKLMPLSVELQRAIEADGTSRDYNENIKDMLDIPATQSYEPVDAAPEALESGVAQVENQPKQ